MNAIVIKSVIILYCDWIISFHLNFILDLICVFDLYTVFVQVRFFASLYYLHISLHIMCLLKLKIQPISS